MSKKVPQDIQYTIDPEVVRQLEKQGENAHAVMQKNLHTELNTEFPDKSFAIKWSAPNENGFVKGTIFEAKLINNG